MEEKIYGASPFLKQGLAYAPPPQPTRYDVEQAPSTAPMRGLAVALQDQERVIEGARKTVEELADRIRFFLARTNSTPAGAVGPAPQTKNVSEMAQLIDSNNQKISALIVIMQDLISQVDI